MFRISCAVLAVVLCACGSKDAKTGGAAPVKAYPGTADGLRALVTDAMAAARDGRDADANAIGASLELPNADAWFAATFGPEVGGRLAVEYAPMKQQLGQLAPLMKDLIAKGRTEISVEKFDAPGDPMSTGLQSNALKAMTQRVPLYSMRATEPGKTTGFHLYSFVYVDGGWRLAGKMKKVDPVPAPPEVEALGELRMKDAREFLASGKLPE